jgi:hypothetical protein
MTLNAQILAVEARPVLAVFGHCCGHFLTIPARYFQAAIFDDHFCSMGFCCNRDEQTKSAESAIRNQPSMSVFG